MHPSVYESIQDFQTEQHANSIQAEQLLSGVVKARRRAKYEILDEELQRLITNFHFMPRDMYFKQARALFHF